MAGGKLCGAIEKEGLGGRGLIDPAIMAAIFGLAADANEAAGARRDSGIEQRDSGPDIIKLDIAGTGWAANAFPGGMDDNIGTGLHKRVAHSFAMGQIGNSDVATVG
jgi:hypothetical protein